MINDLSILRKISPGYCRYIVFLGDHGVFVVLLSTIPTNVPPTTAITVRMVRRLFKIIFWTLDIVTGVLKTNKAFIKTKKIIIVMRLN